MNRTSKQKEIEERKAFCDVIKKHRNEEETKKQNLKIKKKKR